METTYAIESVSQRPRTSARFLLHEAAGSLGDLGTFVPIVVGMTQLVGLDAATVLVFAGLMNIVSGLVFRVPIAVQPMKAIAAIAIAGALGAEAGAMSAQHVAVAGLAAGGIILLMGATGIMGRVDRIVPRPVLRAFQMAVAFKLLVSGARLGLLDPDGEAFLSLLGADGLLVAGAALALVLLLRRKPQAMAIGLMGLAFALAAVKRPDLLQSVSFGLWRPHWVLSDASAISGIWLGGMPQVPLTLLNSVLAVSVLATDLYPEQRERNTPKRMAISVGLMNLISCPFGGMPVCHGSGGLAAQHRFGARTGLSMVMLGSVKLLIGLLFGAAALAWMQAFPSCILGVFLLVAGAGLAGVSRCWTTRPGLVAACVMIGVHLVSGQLLLGFAAGWLLYALTRLWNKSHSPA